jgi:AcrR family transcriptional regulator
VDLRIIKTRNSIRKAFLKLRAKNSLERIRVTELCQIAIINKTTFYKYYQDIYALSEEIEDETIKSIMDSFKNIDSLFSDPYNFVKGFYHAFKSQEKIILILFSGRINVLIDKIERRLKSHYSALKSDPETDILMSFLFRGAAQVLIKSKYDETILLDTVADITRQIIVSLDLRNTAS